jgi:hypothetical protein
MIGLEPTLGSNVVSLTILGRRTYILYLTCRLNLLGVLHTGCRIADLYVFKRLT